MLKNNNQVFGNNEWLWTWHKTMPVGTIWAIFYLLIIIIIIMPCKLLNTFDWLLEEEKNHDPNESIRESIHCANMADKKKVVTLQSQVTLNV